MAEVAPYPSYISANIHGDRDDAEAQLLTTVNRNLISPAHSDAWMSFCPISSNRFPINDEIAILLAFFHMSNVVRYNPTDLYRLMDSKYWVLPLSLRKHGFLHFLKLMWGHFVKESFDIV
jgi:hypothetical protein